MLIVIGLCATGCANNKGNQGNQNTNNKVTTGSSLEDNFEWNGNIITALSDSGAKQTDLVIPERCEGFDGMIFADKENNVVSVSFESDKDVHLNGVFGGAKNIKSIALPAQLSEVADLEFWLCSSLEEITIPAGVTTVGAYAFQNNEKLTKITFDGEITSIMPHAFDGCTSLKDIILPDSITTIDEYAFYDCASLEKIMLPVSLNKVGAFAFANSGLVDITVPRDMKLEQYEKTSFVQKNHNVSVTVSEGSWADQNFDTVFDGAFTKTAIE